MAPAARNPGFTFVPDAASVSLQQNQQPGAGRGRANKRTKGLTIVHYDPSGKKRRGLRGAATERAAGSSNDGDASSSSAEIGRVKEGPAPARIERIPSSRSWDPFNALAVLYVSKEERFMLNYAYTRSWAVWADPHTGDNNFAQAWTSKAMESSACFYSQIVGAATHYQIARRETPITSDKLAAVRLQCKAKAIDKLRREIDQYHHKSTSVPFDALIMAIFCLAVHDNIDNTEQPEAPMSLLAKLRDMQVYYRVLFADEHMQILYRLIEENGGLGNLDKTAFGAVVPLLDMMYAARKQQPPRIPSPWKLRPSVHPAVWLPDARAKELLDTSGTYFRNGLQEPYLLDEELCAALVALSDVSVALDHFHRKGPKVFKAAHIWLENSDWASHKLLSTPSFLRANEDAFSLGELPEASDVDPSLLLCEISRLVGMMYMDVTIFPSGREAGVRIRIAKEIYSLLELVQQVIPNWKVQTSVYDLVLWAALMNTTGVLPQDLQDLYTAFIAEMCTKTQLEDWTRIESKLRAFLWLSPVCDEPAREACSAARALQVTEQDD